MQLFCAFARNPAKGEELVIERVVANMLVPVLRDDVQAVMASIGSRSEADVALERAASFRPHLQYANLSGVGLYNANLSDAFPWGADLSWAYLGKARLDSVVLKDVNLSNVQFSNEGEDPATGLTQRQLDAARADPAHLPDLNGVLNAETADGGAVLHSPGTGRAAPLAPRITAVSWDSRSKSPPKISVEQHLRVLLQTRG